MEREYSIGEAARIVGVSPSTVRLWADRGLASARRTGAGHRRFGRAEIGRMRRIRELRESQGLPLDHIRGRLREEVGEAPPDDTDAGGSDHLGVRLRSARRATGVSLRALAARCEVSPSHLSAIERGHGRPSVAILSRLAGELGLTLGSLRTAGSPERALVRSGEAGVLDLVIPGVVIQDLAPAARSLEPQLFVLDPGAASGGGYRHEGEEFLFVLEGALEVVLDGTERYVVQAGDSLCFPSIRTHRWRNCGGTVARVLWINTPPTF